MKDLLNKITSLDEETFTIAKAVAFLIRCLGVGLGAGLFVGIAFVIVKYAPLVVDKL